MCLNLFFKKKLGENKILPYNVCSHCCHNSIDIVNLKCGHLICGECLQVVNIMTNEEKDLCIVCARNIVRNMAVKGIISE
uniref:RING-type domain-containing protein n=1 Tax=viral metagenome TaxID=1070528 RepID=A0A6C0IFK1_9ZZZZ